MNTNGLTEIVKEMREAANRNTGDMRIMNRVALEQWANRIEAACAATTTVALCQCGHAEGSHDFPGPERHGCLIAIPVRCPCKEFTAPTDGGETHHLP